MFPQILQTIAFRSVVNAVFRRRLLFILELQWAVKHLPCRRDTVNPLRRRRDTKLTHHNNPHLKPNKLKVIHDNMKIFLRFESEIVGSMNTKHSKSHTQTDSYLTLTLLAAVNGNIINATILKYVKEI